MDLSIVVINWNTRDMLRDCLASVFEGLAALKAEVIVVDNASEDGSPEMVEADFPQALLIRNTQNRGFAAANNQGFEIARGRHVLLLNSDTIVHGEVLEASVDYLDADSDTGAMGCRVLNADGTAQLTCSMFPTTLNLALELSGLQKLRRPRWFGRYHMTHWQRDDERPVEVISGCYLMVRREIIDSVGPLDEDFFFFGEETDWCQRIADAGWKLMFAPVGKITHFGGGSVKKLNHKRDLMLSEGLVRLHRKHNGWLNAMLVALLILAFNSSRALYWTILRGLARSVKAQERSNHFLRIVAEGGTVWPRP